MDANELRLALKIRTERDISRRLAAISSLLMLFFLCVPLGCQTQPNTDSPAGAIEQNIKTNSDDPHGDDPRAEKMELRSYFVGDLIGDDGPETEIAQRGKSLVNLIKAFVEKSREKESESKTESESESISESESESVATRPELPKTEPDEQIELSRENPGNLTILQTPGVHTEIGRLLDTLRQIAKDTAAGKPAPRYDYPPESRAAKEKLMEKLQQKVTLDFQDEPLAKAVERLKPLVGMEVRLDEKELENMGCDPNTRVTLHVKDVSLRSALKVILKDLDLTYMLEKDSLSIASIERAAYVMYFAFYPVGDLLFIDKSQEFNEDYFAEMIVSTVKPDSWETNGGEGVIVPVSLHNIRALAVYSVDESHDDIDLLLDRFRIIAKHADYAPNDFSPFDFDKSADEPGKNIDKILKSPFSYKCKNTPLSTVIDQLSNLTGVSMSIDKKALTAVGVDCSQLITITIQADDVPLWMLLKKMLGHLDLGFINRDEHILITSLDKQREELKLVVYPVGDLSSIRIMGIDYLGCFGVLFDLLPSTIVPDSWETNGGCGTISGMKLANADYFIINQSEEVHFQIEEVFAFYRRIIMDAEKGRAASSYRFSWEPYDLNDEKKNDDEEPNITLIADLYNVTDLISNNSDYEKTDEEYEQIVNVLQSCLCRDSWDANGGFARVGGIILGKAKLVHVNQTAETHLEIKEMMNVLHGIVKDSAEGKRLASCYSVVQNDKPTGQDEPRLLVKIYPVADVIARLKNDATLKTGEKPGSECDALVERIKRDIYPKSWSESDGNGGIAPLELRDVKMLVVSQTAEAHRLIAETLEKLRAAE
jgi:hypothetical protein